MLNDFFYIKPYKFTKQTQVVGSRLSTNVRAETLMGTHWYVSYMPLIFHQLLLKLAFMLRNKLVKQENKTGFMFRNKLVKQVNKTGVLEKIK